MQKYRQLLRSEIASRLSPHRKISFSLKLSALRMKMQVRYACLPDLRLHDLRFLGEC